MILLVILALTALIFIGKKRRWDEFGVGLLIVFLCFFIAISMILCGCIANGRTLESKIEMYSQENVKIEEDISNLVEKYMRHESETFKLAKGESAIQLISLYPELKSDELVKQQINIYTENIEEIKFLKASKLNVSNYKFWLYLGK